VRPRYTDRILADVGGSTLDFGNVENLSGLEYINMDGTAGQELTLSDVDLLSVSDTGSILIFGDSLDTVNATGFESTDTSTNVNGQTLDQYTLNGAEIWVDEEVTVVI
jgi:hypothetical protein